MKKTRFLYGVLLCVLMVPVPAEEFSIAVVNLTRLLSEAPQARTALQELQKEFEPRQQALRQQEEQLISAANDLKKNEAIMSDTENRDARLSLREQQRDLGFKQEKYLEEFNLRRNEVLGRLQKTLMAEVDSFAQRENYDLIIGEGILFANSAVDVTSQILSGLQSAFQNNN